MYDPEGSCPISISTNSGLFRASGEPRAAKKRYFYIMIQQLFVLLLFIGALAYLGRLLYQSFKAKSSGCASGCGKCGAIDVAKIEADIRKNKNF